MGGIEYIPHELPLVNTSSIEALDFVGIYFPMDIAALFMLYLSQCGSFHLAYLLVWTTLIFSILLESTFLLGNTTP